MQQEIKTRLIKTLKGAIIAGSGVAVVYVLQAVAQMDFGQYTPIIAAMSSILINAVRLMLPAPPEQKQ